MGKKVTLSNTCAVLIDMQKDFIFNKPNKLKLIPSQVSILRFCVSNRIPIVIFEYVGYGNTAPEIKEAVKGKPGAHVYCLNKKYDDAFYKTELNKILVAHNTKNILIMGVNAGFCVYETTKSALENGYSVTTSKDLIAGYRSKINKSPCSNVLWYKKNTIFFDNHKIIIENIN